MGVERRRAISRRSHSYGTLCRQTSRAPSASGGSMAADGVATPMGVAFARCCASAQATPDEQCELRERAGDLWRIWTRALPTVRTSAATLDHGDSRSATRSTWHKLPVERPSCRVWRHGTTVSCERPAYGSTSRRSERGMASAHSRPIRRRRTSPTSIGDHGRRSRRSQLPAAAGVAACRSAVFEGHGVRVVRGRHAVRRDDHAGSAVALRLRLLDVFVNARRGCCWSGSSCWARASRCATARTSASSSCCPS